MITLLLSLLVAGAPALSLPAQDPAPAVVVPAYPNSTCPIMGKAISARLYTDTVRGRIYVCCKSCIPKIQADVETAYKSSYPTTTKLNNALCPVTGKPVPAENPPSVVLQGREIALSSPDCVTKAQEEAQIVLALAANPKWTDLRNAVCPVTGKPVAKNSFVVIGDTLVRLAAPDLLETVRKDPAAVLKKARETTAPPQG